MVKKILFVSQDPGSGNALHLVIKELTKKNDFEAYNDLFKEMERLIKEVKPNLIQKEPLPKNEGFCIRCKETIKLDPSQPYCEKDYQQWNKFKKENYEEKKGVCHICGKPNGSSLKKPVCINCYKKNKYLFEKS